MSVVTIATFNAENLFARFKFKDYTQMTSAQLAAIARDGWLVDKTYFEVANPPQRKLTAQAILETKADVIALQEIECLDTLRRFNTQWLKTRYPYQLVIDSRDPRLIDVGILSKYPFARIQTHQFRKSGTKYVFSRDCLEVDIDLGQKTLPLFINHFKSMMGGRAATAARRLEQAREVVEILKQRFNNTLTKTPFVVLGDLNDYQPSQAISTLINGAKLENVNDRLPADDQWTHYWAKGKEYHQLDYILLSKALAQSNPTVKPKIERRGMPKRASNYTGERFAGVGQDNPKASDHCPVSITLNV